MGCPDRSGSAHLWMDQGGTFTDVIAVAADGTVRVEKHLSDRADLTAPAGVDVRRGTTVATNALLERTGVPVLLLTNRGFADLPWIGDQTRAELFSLTARRPPPLCAAVLEVDGRIAADGAVLEPADVDVAALRAHRARGLTAVCVALIHGPLAAGEELRLGARCRAAGFSQVTLAHEVAPSRGFLDRLHTALADAALSPLLPRLPGHYMRSDGGLARVTAEDSVHSPGPVEWRGCHAILSGPAGGVVATAALARAAGAAAALGFDMGGTSTDVCRVAGAPERADSLEIGGLRLRVPVVRLHTVAAGGGSRLTLRSEIYAVGPESAGADPGPAAYGRGGPATITCAEAVLGRLPGFPPVCGPARDGPLDIDAARAALTALDPNRTVEAAAWGFRAVAHETMAQAVRRLAVRRGADPAAHALVAFGGAGPGHACGVAERLGIDTVLVPMLAGVFSAAGIGMARRRAEVVVPITGGLPADVAAAISVARSRLPFSGAVDVRVAARARGTAELLELPAGQELPEEGDLRAAFDAAHRERFGFSRDVEIELVEVRAAVEAPGATPALRPRRSRPAPTTARAWFGVGRFVPLLAVEDARELEGPALLLGAGFTVVVEPGWRAHAEGAFVRLTRIAAGSGPRIGAAADPVHMAVTSARVTSVAERMGERLARLARSVSIRERHDFSCAVFDAEGALVVNAPHVPVHLGAMGETVRDLLARRGPELAPGQTWISNDPYAGGSHLPDITAMRPVFDEAGDRRAFVACRAHHVDVGGDTPGSMPPHSTSIAQEGLILRHHLLAEGGRFLPPPLPGCRQPGEVRADLGAQVAACALGARALGSLGTALGWDVLRAQLDHLLARAEGATRAVLSGLVGAHTAREVLDDGTEISVALTVTAEGAATLRLRAPAHPGNLNAPRGIARAATLYVLRCLSDADLPLSEGALRPIVLDLEPGGLFDPDSPRAVCGGNVETSQRLVCALLRAVGAQAGSQGTMNNLTVGMPGETWYETIGGGGGAGPGYSGRHARQVHMTNTRATDVEELEARFAVRLERWARRRGSGGRGRFPGGDGVIKEWRFLASARVALLVERRAAGAPGLGGGGPGAPGCDQRDRGAGWETAPSIFVAAPGERLRIATPGGGGALPEGAEQPAQLVAEIL